MAWNPLPVTAMKHFLQFMACQRCKVILQEELHAIGLNYSIAELEREEITEIGPEVKYELLRKTLIRYSLDDKLDKKALLVTKLKATVIDMVGPRDKRPSLKWSAYLSEQLGHSYPYISNVFSEVNGSALEQYIIAQRVEAAKPLLLKEELTLKEISWKLGFSSVAHLSSQFKKVAGDSPSGFRLKERRISRDPEDAGGSSELKEGDAVGPV